jgi:hypothetical protein
MSPLSPETPNEHKLLENYELCQHTGHVYFFVPGMNPMLNTNSKSAVNPYMGFLGSIQNPTKKEKMLRN